MELLPAGIAGIVIAAYIAAVMSSADSCLIGPVAIFTNDIYRKQLKPCASDAELVWVARVATIVLGMLAVAIAWLIPNVLDLILYAYTIGAAGLFFPMLGLLFWPRTTAKGAFWSMLTGGISALVWVAADEPVVMIETDKVNVEIPAPESGIVTQILKRDGERIIAIGGKERILRKHVLDVSQHQLLVLLLMLETQHDDLFTIDRKIRQRVEQHFVHVGAVA